MSTAAQSSTASPPTMTPAPHMSRGTDPTVSLLIAAGCIGATLLLAFMIVVLIRMRRAARSRKVRAAYNPYINGQQEWSGPRPRVRAFNAIANWKDAEGNGFPSKPEAAALRRDTDASDMPLMPEMQSLGMQEDGLIPVAEEPSPVRTVRALKRQPSVTPSSPLLPIERGSKEFTEETLTSRTSFPAYLQNYDSTYQPTSRFSWTTRRTTARYSSTTARSSMPRYRTVESWVGVQANNLDQERIQGHLQQEIESQIRDQTPSVPKLPSMEKLKTMMSVSPPTATPPTFAKPALKIAIPFGSSKPAPLVSAAPKSRRSRDARSRDGPGAGQGLKSQRSHKSLKSNRSFKRNRRGSDATVFRVHPGTEVKLPGTRVNSEVLDQNIVYGGAL